MTIHHVEYYRVEIKIPEGIEAVHQGSRQYEQLMSEARVGCTEAGYEHYNNEEYAHFTTWVDAMHAERRMLDVLETLRGMAREHLKPYSSTLLCDVIDEDGVHDAVTVLADSTNGLDNWAIGKILREYG